MIAQHSGKDPRRKAAAVESECTTATFGRSVLRILQPSLTVQLPKVQKPITAQFKASCVKPFRLASHLTTKVI